MEEGQAGEQQPLRPQSAASEQQDDAGLTAGPAVGPQLAEGDGQLVAAGGGAEQPPAEPDPFSLLPAELREAPEAECDPSMQASIMSLCLAVLLQTVCVARLRLSLPCRPEEASVTSALAVAGPGGQVAAPTAHTGHVHQQRDSKEQVGMTE